MDCIAKETNCFCSQELVQMQAIRFYFPKRRIDDAACGYIISGTKDLGIWNQRYGDIL